MTIPSIYKTPHSKRALEEYYARKVKTLAVPASTCMVKTRHGDTNILVAGSGEVPIFLWHGMVLNGLNWHLQIDELGKKYRIYAPDMVGSAGLSAETRMDQRGTAYGEWAADVMAGVGIEQAHHAGISFGGWIILKLAQIAASRIQSAVLISSAGFVDVQTWKILFSLLPRLITTIPNNFANAFLSYMLPPDRSPTPDEIEMFRNSLDNIQNDNAPKAVPDNVLRCLTAPTLLLMGAHEKSFPPEKVIRRAKATIPTLTAELVPGAGHGMTHDAPALVSRKIAEWIDLHL
jgi:pimeloyl-ACP methyl ester carboxylesterase